MYIYIINQYNHFKLNFNITQYIVNYNQVFSFIKITPTTNFFN